MREFSYTVNASAGIHARPAGLLSKLAADCGVDIVVEKDGREAEVKRLLALMCLGVKCGDEITVKVSGEKEDAAYADIKTFFEENL